MATSILVVDDEEEVRAALRGVLGDEGYEVVEAGDGQAALDLLESVQPVLVILDVWMPELDGIEVLKEIQRRRPETRVLVISGHGNIETAVRTIQLGAVDFIEKPFSLEGLLQAVNRALGEAKRAVTTSNAARANAGNGESHPDRAAAVRAARTLRKSVVIHGTGLHSGVRTGLILFPAPPGSGVVFETISSDVEIPALVDYVDSTGYATTLYRDGEAVKTVEHLLASLHAFGVTNLRVKMQGEIPILDGSALEFCDRIESVGVEDQDENVQEYVATESIRIEGEGGKSISLEPCDRFEIDYTLEYPEPVGVEHVRYGHEGSETFRRDVAPARTFGFLKDIAALEEMGLAGGGRLHNCILIGDDGVINTELRIENEFARHKILDIMGDTFLLGRPLRGRIVARMTGHTDNIALLRKIRSVIDAAE